MNVVVIGGGVIGYSVAYALAERDADVHVIEMRRPGGGATQASAGMLAPYLEGHEETLRRLGVLSLERYDAFVHQLEGASGQPIEFVRSGSLQIAFSNERADHLIRDAARLQADGIAHSILSGDEVARIEPAIAQGVVRGLLVPVHGYVHVAQLMSALTHAAASRGVRTTIDRVVGIERRPTGVGVVTTTETIHASAVVVAAGSWSSQLAVAQSPQVPVRPVKGQLVEIARPTPALSRVVWGEDCYLVPWRNGSVIVGATVEDVGFDESPTPEAAESLLECARHVMPELESAAKHSVRVGLRPATRDELPLIGWSSTMPDVCLSTGHYRNGVLLAPLTAALVAGIVLGIEATETRWARDVLAPSRMGL